jgi:hypothetical protein
MRCVEVRFVIVGGTAATAHGSGRLTLDLDVVCDRSADNVDRLVSCLAPFHPSLRGAPPGLPFVLDAHTLGRAWCLAVGIEKLIALKRAAGRPKDLEAIEDIRPGYRIVAASHQVMLNGR